MTQVSQSATGQFNHLPEDELIEQIDRLRKEKNAVILAHNYQIPQIQDLADVTGDSLGLSIEASKTDADIIVFCGVHFMAESADVLSAPYQRVILPDLSAGCSMADMAAADELEVCWRELEELGVTDVVPVTYMNSAADIKAFCGREGGVVCTSSNSVATLRWGWERGEKILFLPDQHLGRNTAYSMGVPLDEMVVWDPQQPMGGLRPDEVAAAKLILWRGHCSVHTRFSVAQIEQLRLAEPEVRVIVHPECTWEVVQAADASGSTDTIIQRIRESAVGSVWAVGTEIHLVNRLAKEMAPSRTVLTLDGLGCLCSTMFRVSPNHLCWVLESLIEGEVHNQVEVPDDQKHWTRVALDRMLSIQ